MNRLEARVTRLEEMGPNDDGEELSGVFRILLDENGNEIERVCLVDLNLHRASDIEIFRAAREAKVVVMTKDGDFAGLVHQHHR